jgi:2'-5' RNA ligase
MTAQQFDLSYDHFGFWQKPNIIYLAPQDSPDALLTLVQQLSTQVQTLGIPVSDGHYSPHVTLCKKVRQQPTLPLLGNAIAYRADHFALYESRSTTRGVQYIELWRWPLTASNVNITR